VQQVTGFTGRTLTKISARKVYCAVRRHRRARHVAYQTAPGDGEKRVAPERLGYATTILRLLLKIAREKLSIRRILVTCDDDNIGSIRTIEKNGGILENVVSGPDLDKPKRRYWIEAG
jgi:predicted acetyltransferase